MADMKRDLILKIVKALDAVLLAVPFVVVWYAYYATRTVAPFFQKGNWVVIVLFLILYIFYGNIYNGFLVSWNRISEMVYSQALAAAVSDFIMYIVIWLLTKYLPNPLPLLVAFICQIALAACWFALANRWYFATFPPKRTVVVYDMRAGLDGLLREYGLERKFDILVTTHIKDCLKDIDMLQGMDTVFLSGIHSRDRNIILKYCIASGINVYVIPRIGDVIMSGASQRYICHLPMLEVGRYNPSPGYLFGKRVMDLVFSGAALCILSPLLLLTALAVKLGDGGPVFYRQKRLTKDGKEFNILKFRSMRVDAEKDGVARLSTGADDDRVTPVGRLIRKLRLDELPQLFCILSGTMTIVGPRPERPEIAAQYEKEIPEFRLRLQAKAGLTGYAQVYGKYNTIPYDKLQLDLMYIAKPSIMEDLRIMFATVRVLFMAESTEGIAKGQVTAGLEGTGIKESKENIAATEQNMVARKEIAAGMEED
ncbi:MAG: exopolysaccharide biosynthesis polyprenyl glycosylphosphotransferase [Lachnospiraceae bacterium]|nr:exopolysaccharide biosynthesis polyprenyl glycosylphosphotransferase [Lachnospiraceae bacterium]